MTAATLPIVCEQGATFALEVAVTYTDPPGGPYPIDGATAKAQVRATQLDTAALAEFTMANGRVVVDEVNSAVILSMDPADTALLPVGAWLYDLFLTEANGQVQRLLAGSFTVAKRITQ